MSKPEFEAMFEWARSWPPAEVIEDSLIHEEGFNYDVYSFHLSDIIDTRSQEIYEFCRDLIQKGTTNVDLKAFMKMLDEAVTELAQDAETIIKE